MEELNVRLVQLMDKWGYKKSEWAELLGVSPAVISHIYNNRNKAGVDLVQMMLSKFPEINERWLLLGEGEMIREKNAITSEIVREKLSQLARRMNAQKGNLKEMSDLLDDIVELLPKST